MHLLSTSAFDRSLFLNRSLDATAVLEFEQSKEEEEPLAHDSSLTLFQQFFETNQKLGLNDDNVLDMISEYELLCCDHLSVTTDLIRSKVRDSVDSKNLTKLESVLRLERNSWRLIHALFADRIRFADQLSDDMIVDNIIRKMSDKEVIEKMFEVNSQMRQMQIVIDWLERNQMDDCEETVADKVHFYSEGSAAVPRSRAHFLFLFRAVLLGKHFACAQDEGPELRH